VQRYELEHLKLMKKNAIDDNKVFKRDMLLNAGTVEEYSKREQEQTKKIKLLKNKIQILEKSLS